MFARETLGLAGWMEWETETDQTIDASIVSDQAGDAPTHGLAADDESIRRGPLRLDQDAQRVQQHRLAVRRAPTSSASMRAMYGKRKRTTRTPVSASPDAICRINGDAGP